jgi:uncharacterized protein YqhQ
MMLVVQEKTQSYIEQTPGDDFIPFLLKCMGVFIFILINFLSLVHRLVSCVIIGLH